MFKYIGNIILFILAIYLFIGVYYGVKFVLADSNKNLRGNWETYLNAMLFVLMGPLCKLTPKGIGDTIPSCSARRCFGLNMFQL